MKKITLSILVFLIGLTSGTAFLNKLPVAIGATIPTSVALFETSLANRITSSSTSMTLVSATTKDGTTLSGTYAFIIDEGTAAEEFVIADCTGTACTSMTRGVSVITGTSSVTALTKEHRRGASVKITDAPQLLILSRILNGQETVPNVLSYNTSPTFSTALQIITKGYADALVASGVATSSESNFGGVWLSTKQQQASSTDGGVNQPYVLQSKYATSTPVGTSGALHTVIAEATGKISQVFLDIFSTVNNWLGHQTFSAGFTSNATSTLADITIGTNSVALTASTTITGGATPQPVYVASSTNPNAGGVLLADGNDINAVDFIGFAVSNATAGQTVYVQKDGVVNGFTGLTKGATYYVQDAVGTIGTSTGTYEIKVGVAVSSTELLVQRGYDEYIGSAAFDSGNHTTESAVSTTTIPVNAKKVVVELGYRSFSSHISYTQFVVYRHGVTSGNAKEYHATTGDAYNLTSYTWSGNDLVITTPIISTSAQNSGTVYFYK